MTRAQASGAVAVCVALGIGVRPVHAQTTPPTQSTQAEKPKTSVLPLTDEDRKAAFPAVDGHTVHDKSIHYFVLFDQLEWQNGRGGRSLSIDSKAWVGGDRDRLWLRAEGEAEGTKTGASQAQFLYGRAIARWWDLVAGVRQDFGGGPGQTWAAIGLQGLAPYWFEVEATAYVGQSGRTHVRLETEYELLLTNRLVLQPLVEVELYGRAIPERGIGRGLSTSGVGLRMRYEIRREIAPYVGVSWERKYGGTGDFARAAGDPAASARFTLGLRTWF